MATPHPEAPRRSESSASDLSLGRLPEPSRLGRYVVLGELGRGGMGTVLDAFDPSLDRRVALKVLRSGMAERHRQRLVREALAMAKLSHPNVVQVYEVGEAGEHVFIAMERVAGSTLQAWLSQEPRPGWRECVQVFVQAGEGLAAAHAEGLVHRDFKPSNAIIDDKGRVRVLDFGLARQAEAPASPDGSITPPATALGATLTQTGAVLGTPAYMPPEQIRGGEADARSDQFSFCVSLYEGLYGERPFEGGSLVVLMHSIAHGRVRPVPKGSTVPEALRRVVLRGLAAAPEDRWPSMEALLVALRRRVESRRGRWLAVGIVGGVVAIAGHQGQRLVEERAHAEAQARAAEAELEAEQRRAEAERRRQQALALAESARLELDAAGQPMRALAYLVPALELDPESYAVHTLLGRALEGPEAHAGDLSVDGSASTKWASSMARVALTDEDDRIHLFRLDADGTHHASPAPTVPGKPVELTLSPDGATLAVIDEGGVVHVIDGELGTTRLRLPAPDPRARLAPRPARAFPARARDENRLRASVAFTLDGSMLVTGDADGKVRLWDASTGTEVRVLAEGTEPVAEASVAAGGHLIVRRAHEGEAEIWDMSSGALRHRMPDAGKVLFDQAGAHTVKLSPASLRRDGAVAPALLFRTRDWTVVEWGDLRDEVVEVAAFSPSGEQLALAHGKGGAVQLRDVGTGLLVRELDGHGSQTTKIVFSHDGRHLAIGTRDGETTLWNVESGRRVQQLPMRRSGRRIDEIVGRLGVRSLAFSADDSHVFVTGDGGVSRWRVGPRGRLASVEGHGAALASGNGRVVLGVDREGGLVRRGASLEPLGPPLGGRGSVLVSSDDGAVVGRFDDWDDPREPSGWIWDASTGRELLTIREPAADPTLSPKGSYLAVARSKAATRSTTFFSAPRGEELGTIPDTFRDAFFTPEEDVAVVMAMTGSPPDEQGHRKDAHSELVALALPSLEERARIASPIILFAATMSPSGTHVAAGEMFGRVLVWAHASGQEPVYLIGHAGPVPALAFGPDGRLLASFGTMDAAVRVWDHATGTQVGTLEVKGDAVEHLAFSPDGRLLAGTRASGSITVWEAEGLQHVATIEPGMDDLVGLRFLPDGHALHTWDREGAISTWAVRRDPLDLAKVREVYDAFSGWQLLNGVLIGR